MLQTSLLPRESQEDIRRPVRANRVADRNSAKIQARWPFTVGTDGRQGAGDAVSKRMFACDSYERASSFVT